MEDDRIPKQAVTHSYPECQLGRLVQYYTIIGDRANERAKRLDMQLLPNT